MGPVVSFIPQQIVNNQDASDVIEKLRSGQMTAEDALGYIAQTGIHLTPEQEAYLSSLLANQRTNEARDYETQMANTDFTRAAAQLGALGMSPYNVLQSGASYTPNVSAAPTPMLNNANQRYNRAVSIANSMIGMASRMASAGIYGNALMGVRQAANKAAALSAHSAEMITTYDQNDNRTGRTIKDRITGTTEDIDSYFGW